MGGTKLLSLPHSHQFQRGRLDRKDGKVIEHCKCMCSSIAAEIALRQCLKWFHKLCWLLNANCLCLFYFSFKLWDMLCEMMSFATNMVLSAEHNISWNRCDDEKSLPYLWRHTRIRPLRSILFHLHEMNLCTVCISISPYATFSNAFGSVCDSTTSRQYRMVKSSKLRNSDEWTKTLTPRQLNAVHTILNILNARKAIRW